jgi:glycine cleavage system H protein
MDAGVVDYKLCAHHFTCEQCSFDAMVRTENRLSRTAEVVPASAHSAESPADTGASRGQIDSSNSADEHGARMLRNFLRTVGRQTLPDDRLYSSNHTWAKADGDGRYVLGVDHFIGTILPSDQSVAFSVLPTHIKAGEPYAWIVANGETVAVRSPIAGTIGEHNASLADRSCVIHSDPYGKGWIAKIHPDDERPVASLQQADRFASTLSRDAERFEKTIRTAFRHARPGSGATMYDGGTAVDDFAAMLGTKKIYHILEQFLRSKK